MPIIDFSSGGKDYSVDAGSNFMSLSPDEQKEKLRSMIVERGEPAAPVGDGVSASDAMWFAGKLGFYDSARGIGQLAGKAGLDIGQDEDEMAADQAKLNRLIQSPEYGKRVLGAYFGGLVADPITWALPIAKLKHIGTGWKAIKQLAKPGAIGGAISGGVGYVDPEAESLLPGDQPMSRLEQAGIGAGAGALLGPLIGGGAKLAAKGKELYTPVGEAAWRALTTNPEIAGGTVGSLIGYNLEPDAPVEDRMLTALKGAALGAGMPLAVRGADKALGTDMRGAIGRFTIPDFRLDEDYVRGRGRAFRDRSKIRREFTTVYDMISKETPENRKILYGMLSDPDAPIEKSLQGLEKEARATITRYAKQLRGLGVLDRETYLKNVDKYIHRSYLRPKSRKFGSTAEKITTMGDELRLRGLREEVSEEFFKAGRRPDRKGEWEIISTDKKGIATIRRDWTPEERKAMGEVTDAAYAFDRTGRLMANDVSAYRFFRDIANDKNSGRYWTDEKGGKFTRLLSNQEFPDSKAKVYGAMHGKYVTEEIYRDLKRVKNLRTGAGPWILDKLERSGYRSLNRFWKQVHTGENPSTHTNNIMSNVQVYDYYDGRIADLWDAAKALKTKNQFYQDALDDGVFGGGVLSHEMNRGREEILDAYSDAARRFSIGDRGDKAVDQILQYVPKIAITSAKNTKKYTWDAMLKLYQLEDHVFRLGLYKKLKAQYAGQNLSDAGIRAAKEAREAFVDYEKTAPLLEILREGPLPFIAYMYGIMPRLAEIGAKKPWKVAKWGLIWHGINQIGEDMSDPEEVAEQRRLMDAEKRRPMYGIPGGPPPMLKLPADATPGSRDDPYLDVGRMWPGGADIFGTTDKQFNIDWLPPAAQPSFGAAGAIANTIYGRQPFTGRKIPKGERLDYLARQFTPNIPLPGLPSYAKDKLKGALSGKYSETKDVYTPSTAMLSNLGIKVTPVSTKKLKERAALKHYSKLTELRRSFKALQNNYEAGRIDEEEFMKKRDKIFSEIKKAQKKARQQLIR